MCNTTPIFCSHVLLEFSHESEEGLLSEQEDAVRDWDVWKAWEWQEEPKFVKVPDAGLELGCRLHMKCTEREKRKLSDMFDIWDTEVKGGANVTSCELKQETSRAARSRETPQKLQNYMSEWQL